MTEMKISVITTAYNHQDTIQRAIDSVRMQEGVEVEHIIIDDTHTKNGMMQTFLQAFNQCEGEYIAICDGDDYHIDKYKLLHQLQYMQKHPQTGLCIHRVFTEINGVRTGMPNANYVNQRLTFDNMIMGKSWIMAQSYFIRKSVFDRYIDYNKFIKLGFNLWDLPLVLTLINHTKFHCLNFYGSVFTKNIESATNTRKRSNRLKYILNSHYIRWYFIFRYGCKFSTKLWMLYRFVRDVYSIIFRRWYQ